jgi:hypothetical protein
MSRKTNWIYNLKKRIKIWFYDHYLKIISYFRKNKNIEIMENEIKNCSTQRFSLQDIIELVRIYKENNDWEKINGIVDWGLNRI